MKRFVLIAMASVTAAACGMPSGITEPTTAQGTASTVSYAAMGACPSPTPTGPLPFAVFGHPQGQGCPTSTPNVLSPAFSVSPNRGTAPLNNVDFSMCGSTDTDPSITLHFAVSYGDGSPDDGSDKVCHFLHSYPNVGSYGVTECVWDEIPAHAPGACKNFTVQVGLAATCTLSFGSACYFQAPGPVSIQAAPSGTACPANLILQAVQGGQVITSKPQPCSPSNQSGCFYNFPFPFGSGGPPPNTTVSGVNATGSTVVPPGTSTGC
jgi:hypothetical protein